MQVGEAVFPGEFTTKEDHNEQTCPWHQKKEGQSDPMDAQDPDEDVDTMPENLGEKLGKNIGAHSMAKKLRIPFHQGESVEYTKGKVVQTYQRYDEHEFDLQYAPHHLIPGNESLKGSPVVPYLGEDGVIGPFKKGAGSKIKKGSVGYDVNRGENGVWLPSPYALSNSNEWPAQAGIKALLRRKGGDVLVNTIEEFKMAYVAASIHAAGDRQFHMRHKDYSDKVREILGSIADRLDVVSQKCPIVPDQDKNAKKFDPPYGLVARLDALSSNLRRMLVGELWRPPLYTDSLTEKYVATLIPIESKGQVDKIL